MGFFDEVSKQGKEKQSLAKAKQTFKGLYKEYTTVLKRLERTDAYSSALKEVREKAFNDFKDYFSSRGFFINPTKFSNVEGFEATQEDFEAELLYEGSNMFRFTVKTKISEVLTLEDRKANPVNFQGRLLNNEIIMGHEVPDEEKLKVYLEAAEDIQKDIADIKELLNQDYKPDLHFYLSNAQDYVNDITEYLNILNEQL